MNDERHDRDGGERHDARLDALFRADPGPSSSELAAARLLLKRGLARERGEPGATDARAHGASRPLLRVVPRRIAWIASQACGFALLVALLAPLVPLVPRLLPAPPAGARGPDLVASLADGARSMGARLKPWLPSLPSLPELPRPYSMSMEMQPAATRLLDWIPSLHSGAR